LGRVQQDFHIPASRLSEKKLTNNIIKWLLARAVLISFVASLRLICMMSRPETLQWDKWYSKLSLSLAIKIALSLRRGSPKHKHSARRRKEQFTCFMTLNSKITQILGKILEK
jgi:hypothetical protein